MNKATTTTYIVQALDSTGWVNLTEWKKQATAEGRAQAVARSYANTWTTTRVVTDFRDADNSVVFEYAV